MTVGGGSTSAFWTALERFKAHFGNPKAGPKPPVTSLSLLNPHSFEKLEKTLRSLHCEWSRSVEWDTKRQWAIQNLGYSQTIGEV